MFTTPETFQNLMDSGVPSIKVYWLPSSGSGALFQVSIVSIRRWVSPLNGAMDGAFQNCSPPTGRFSTKLTDDFHLMFQETLQVPPGGLGLISRDLLTTFWRNATPAAWWRSGRLLKSLKLADDDARRWRTAQDGGRWTSCWLASKIKETQNSRNGRADRMASFLWLADQRTKWPRLLPANWARNERIKSLRPVFTLNNSMEFHENLVRKILEQLELKSGLRGDLHLNFLKKCRWFHPNEWNLNVVVKSRDQSSQLADGRVTCVNNATNEKRMNGFGRANSGRSECV